MVGPSVPHRWLHEWMGRIFHLVGPIEMVDGLDLVGHNSLVDRHNSRKSGCLDLSSSSFTR